MNIKIHKIVKYIGNITIGSNGYTDIAFFFPQTPAGYSFLCCLPWDYGSATTSDAWGVNASGMYVYGTKNATISSVSLCYIYVDTNNFSS